VLQGFQEFAFSVDHFTRIPLKYNFLDLSHFLVLNDTYPEATKLIHFFDLNSVADDCCPAI